MSSPPMGKRGALLQRQSARMALCGLLAALSVVFLSLGSLIPAATFACPMLAMVCLLPVVCEYGGRTALMVYAAVACLAVLLCADKELALFYTALGWYPALRPKLERLPRLPGVAVKCVLFLLPVTAMYAFIVFIFRLEAVAEEPCSAGAAAAGLLLFGCAVFLLFDRTLRALTLVYLAKRRHGANFPK